MKKPRHIALLAAMLSSASLVFGQVDADTTDVGGGDGLFFETPACDPFTHGNWDHEDSLRFIPAHDLYGSWETDAIFSKDLDLSNWKDTVVLQVTYAPCDHTLPIHGTLNSPFGPRHGRMHYGIDLDLESGDAVVAAFEGMVRIARMHPTYGNVVVLRHANGLETLYGHLSWIAVEPGHFVEAGQLLGAGGSTGRSTGSHLHFEVRYLGQPIDPQKIFDLEGGDLLSDELVLHKGSFGSLGKSIKPVARYHVVRRGDTLSAIARRNRTSINALCKLNRIGTRSKLRIGQRLRIG